MQPRFEALITQVMGCHAPTRGYFLLKTPQVYFRLGIQLCWGMKIRFYRDQSLTVFGTLLADFF